MLSLEATWRAVPCMRANLAMVEDMLRRVLSEDDSPAVRRVSLYLVEAGGKRLRPALLLLSGEAAGGDATKMIRAAAAVEMLHVATLYHDDVIDGALSRRGRPSTNALWGNRVSAMGGTYLVARAMDLVAEQGAKALEIVNLAVTRVWHGQMRELEGIYRIDRTEEECLEALSQKTAAFYQLPCMLGAQAAGAEPRVAGALESFGKFTGIGFQIIDDILDLVGDRRSLGKPTGGDIRAGVYTLPVIHALAKKPERSRLRSLLARESMSEEAQHEAAELVRKSGAIEYALSRAKEFVAQALSELDRLPVGFAVEALRSTAQAIIERPELKTLNEGVM